MPSHYLFAMNSQCLRVDNACNDLVAISDSLIRQPESVEWRVDKYTRMFDAALEDQKSYQTDTIIVYVNYKLQDSKFEPVFCLIYFMSVSVFAPLFALSNVEHFSGYRSTMRLNHRQEVPESNSNEHRT